MNRTIATAVLCLLVSSAETGAQTIHTTCYGGWRNPSCATYMNYGPRASNVITITPEDQARAAEREAKWSAYCKPTLGAPDQYGVRRYSYAKPGCESGRSED